MLEIERGGTRSRCVEHWLWCRRWTCRKVDYEMNEVLKSRFVWEKCSVTSGTRPTDGTRGSAGWDVRYKKWELSVSNQYNAKLRLLVKTWLKKFLFETTNHTEGMSVCFCFCCVLCDGPITHSGESYRAYCVCPFVIWKPQQWDCLDLSWAVLPQKNKKKRLRVFFLNKQSNQWNTRCKILRIVGVENADGCCAHTPMLFSFTGVL